MTSPAPTHGAIATPHRLATDAGRRAFEAGGNALDAALAAAAVLAVVYPHNTGIGGDLVALVRSPDGRVSAVNATGWAPAGASSAAMRRRHGAELPVRGMDTLTVPGAVRGWQALAARGARLPREDLLRAAVACAEDGVPVAASLALCLASEWPALPDEGFRRVFGTRGRPRQRGEQLRQPALARTLRTLAHDGWDAMYTDVAGGLVDRLRGRGVAFEPDDWSEFVVDESEPLVLEWRGMRVHTMGPNTQGFALLRNLVALDRDGGARVEDVLARSFGEGNVLRDTALGDPRLHDIRVDDLIHAPVAAAEPVAVADPRLARGDTVGVAAADADGWSVSLVQSLFHLFGSGVYDLDSGVLFQNRGSSFSLQEGAVNGLAPRSRPAHTLMPVIVTDPAGEPAFVQATMGGKAQAQIHTHLFLALAAGASARETVDRPRWTVGPYAPGDRSDTVYAEANVPDEAISAFHAAGRPVVTVPPLTEMLGHSNVVRILPGGFDAAADSRSDGSAWIHPDVRA